MEADAEEDVAWKGQEWREGDRRGTERGWNVFMVGKMKMVTPWPAYRVSSPVDRHLDFDYFFKEAGNMSSPYNRQHKFKYFFKEVFSIGLNSCQG